MGFYPPDALIHEAQRRGIEVLPPDVNESGAECEMEFEDFEADAERDSTGGPQVTRRVRVGLGYVRGVREQEVKDLVSAREEPLADLIERASGR